MSSSDGSADGLPGGDPVAVGVVDVRTALQVRKNGATAAECERVAKTLARLQPAAAEAMRRAPKGCDGSALPLAVVLEALADD